jgi:hypothetical protein
MGKTGRKTQTQTQVQAQIEITDEIIYHLYSPRVANLAGLANS